MDTTVCDQVRRFLRAVPDSDQHRAHLETLAVHVAGCPRCRGALALFAAAIRVPPPSQPPSYESCEHDLAAYIEREAEEGVIGAARAFPHVWWALWVDPECAAVYTGTRALFTATARGELAPIPFARRMAPQLRLTPLYVLPRPMLWSALRTQSSAYGAARGSNDTAMVLLDDEEVSDYLLSLSVVQQPNERWAVAVHISPSVAGALVLTLGDETFRAPFDSTNQAVVVGIPGALLATSTGPDLHISIETPL